MLQVKLILAALVAAAFIGVGAFAKYEHGRRVNAERQLADYQAAATAVITERLAAQERTRLENEARTKDVLEAHRRDLARLRARYDQRLRDATPATGGDGAMPAAPEAPGGTDAPAGSGATAEFLRALRSCDEDRETLRALQDWINRVR